MMRRNRDFTGCRLSRAPHQRAIRSLGNYTRSLPAIVILITLAACADKPQIAVDSYCTVKAHELIDMRDPGLQRLIPANQGAVLTGDDNWRKICAGGNANYGGPR